MRAVPRKTGFEERTRQALGELPAYVRRARRVEDSDLLVEVKAQIQAYNRCYPIERECALRYVPLSAIRFRPREDLGPADLLARFPLLPADGR